MRPRRRRSVAVTSSSPTPEPGSAPQGQSLFSVDQGEEADCTVCGEAVESGASALCSECGLPYHLALTNDSEAKNCGEVWLNEEFLALEFGCARCLAALRGGDAPAPATAPSPPATPENAAGAAQSGRVRHEGRSAREIVRRKRR